MLRPEEVEQLVCGCPTLDLRELRKVTLYDGGFKKEDQTIVDFWEVNELERFVWKYPIYVSSDFKITYI